MWMENTIAHKIIGAKRTRKLALSLLPTSVSVRFLKHVQYAAKKTEGIRKAISVVRRLTKSRNAVRAKPLYSDILLYIVLRNVIIAKIVNVVVVMFWNTDSFWHGPVVIRYNDS